jgi:hypothetical protein
MTSASVPPAGIPLEDLFNPVIRISNEAVQRHRKPGDYLAHLIYLLAVLLAELAELFLLGVVAGCPVRRLSPEGGGQVMGLLSPVPGEEQQRRTQRDGEDGSGAVQHGDVDDGGASHVGGQPGGGQPGQPGDEQAAAPASSAVPAR